MLSIIGALMALVYSSIATYFGIANWSGNGSLGGVYNSPASKTWDIFLGLGSYAFAFAYSMLLPEIQDTVREAGNIRKTARAVHISVPLMTVLYLLVSVTCYGALGDAVPPYVLDGFSSPVAPLVIANIAVCIHLIPAYAVYAQPTFALVEEHAFKSSGKLAGTWAKRFFRLGWRSFYVALLAVVAALLPFFGDFVSLIGATGFAPLTVYYPIKMYCIMKKPRGLQLWALRALDVFCWLITIVATIGAVVAIIQDASTYSIGL